MGAPGLLGRGVQGGVFHPPVSPLPGVEVGAGWEEGVVSEGEGVQPSKTRGQGAWGEGRVKRFSAPPSRHYPDPSKPPHGLEEGDGHLSDGSTKKVKTAQSFESLFDSENLSDVLLSVNHGQFLFHAHKMILGLKSERLGELLRSLPLGQAPGEKPVLQLEVAPECSLVFSRFLYFIYSGAVWLHRDYVIPLYQLADKYEVRSLLSHCESYILQLLVNPAAGAAASSSGGEGCSRELPVETVCDLCESEHSSDAIRSTAFSVLCGRFRELAGSDRWVRCGWQVVSDLIRSDECAAEENLILASSTDWMKRNNLQDKKRIEAILSSIRYPLLNRRVLYHIQKNAAFRNFPCVEELVHAAIRYHCFKDLPEAKHDFHGTQFNPRQPPCPGQDPRPLSSVSTSEETLAMCSSAVQPFALLRQEPTPPPN